MITSMTTLTRFATIAIVTTAVTAASGLFMLQAQAMEVSVPTPVHETGFGIPEIIDAPESVESPKELRLDAADMTSVTVSWTPAVFSIAPVRETYRVVMTQKTNGVVMVDQTTSTTAVLVKGLNPNTAYVVTVTRIHGERTSEPVELTVRTSPTTPQPLTVSVKRRRLLRDVISNKPLNDFGGAIGGKYEAVLEWEKSQGTVRYYEVLLYRKGSDEPERTVTSKDTVARISGLKEGRAYEYQVVAYFNDAYASVASERMDFMVDKSTAAAPKRLKPFTGSITTTGRRLP